MSTDNIQILIAMIIYIVAILGIGIYFLKIANASSDNYFIGGRSLGPWVAAMSAEASDMSGWLLMGLPGVAYWCGISDAFWTALGLALGTYLNWKITAKRLRNYSAIAGDAITIPEYFSNRFKESKKVIMLIASVFILVFFTVYAASCFVTVGKLFTSLFGIQYQVVMIAGACFVILYTLLGGFLAESVSDFMQGVIMIIALSLVLILGVMAAGGFGDVMENIQRIPGFFDFFGIANPTVVDGTQQVLAGNPVFGAALPYTFLTIISTMSWGLGYFGVPQVLLRFIAIRDAAEIPKARRIATTWCAISLFAAVFIGLIGRVLFPTELLTPSGAESIFIVMSTNLLPPLIAGFVMAGILAATMSSSDSYLLIAASAFSKNIYEGILKKDATDKEIMRVSHITLIVISIIGVLLALDETSVIFNIVSFAWAGFGATFGPLMIFSLFWKRINREGAIAGMLAGGGMVFIWRLFIKPLGGVFGIYELLPAFLVSCAFIVAVSLMTKEPSQEIQDEFEQVKAASI
ncbi:sodium/proline symporter PutP [Acetobacterium sp. K1/6]|uniref:sodium/proline symporter PutP n=1 Tax=Acetobacterium sp. K1/6 TaxID=3055467 RepID=UPI002ACAEE4E|nr:sodium/proline symporter PutP [Acetobacterium sp. K1/6]MDZ5724499.1 sodium/proline symporter PutP [Acetobacterium sp. K1/6]